MADQWNIHKSDGSTLGPLSPLEVRDALRDGTIDPFDQVSRVGSKVKLTLVEVDEIFRAADDAAKRDSVYENADQNRVTQVASGTHTVLQPPETVPSKLSIAGKKPIAKKPAKKKKSTKRHAKRFHLIDKRKRMLGPLSAGEIQSLFYRGILDHKVQVVKENSDKHVPIAQFISAYAGEQVKQFKSEKTQISLDAHDVLPNSKVLDQFARAAALANVRRENLVPLMASLAFLIFGGIVAFVALDEVFLNHTPEFVQDAPAEPPTEMNEALPVINVTPRPAVKKQVAQTKKVKKASKKRVRKKKISPKRRRPKARTYARRAPSSRLSRPRPVKKVRKRPAPTRRRTSPKRRTKLAAKANPFAPKVGQTATFSSMSYSLSALEACAMKCQLTFKDKGGRSIRAVFFTGAYAPKLRKLRGRATITGRVAGSGGAYSIQLQSVR